MKMPSPKFLRDMGVSSILAGVILLTLDYAQRLWRKHR